MSTEWAAGFKDPEKTQNVNFHRSSTMGDLIGRPAQGT